jgi:MFS family permease
MAVRGMNRLMAQHQSNGRELLQSREFRALLGARGTNALATTALVTVVGYQVYEMTRDPLSLGWLGLVEAIPALALGLFGGHLADRRDRRSIVLVTSSSLSILVLGLALLAPTAASTGLLPVLGVMFLAGVANGFERPALTAFEAQIIPIEEAARGASWVSTTWTAGGIIGPAMGGMAIAVVGVSSTYLLLCALLVVSTLCIALIRRKPIPEPEPGEGIVASLKGGIQYVFRSQPLWSSMALDLFAVLFGGVVALLPVFASDVLHVGPFELGLMRAAPSFGAMLLMLGATRRPPGARAGALLLACVGGFGVSMLVFGLSTTFWVSLVALFASGVTDGLSMVIRMTIVRLFSPEAMRGRIASVSYLFIGASNELGAFESGVAAKLLGVVPAVVAGAMVTLGVVGLVAVSAPELRRLDLRRTPGLPRPEPLELEVALSERLA